MKLPQNKIIRNASWILICRVIQSVFALVITAAMTLLYNAQQKIVDQRNAK